MISTFNRLFFLSALSLVSCVSSTALCQDGLLKVSGQHIRLTTDIDSREEAEQLVASFDAAVPQWGKFWKLAPGALDGWVVDANVIRDKDDFRRRGLIPANIPDFPFGYAAGNTLWVVAQESEYYTRHLLLHEGVHALAFSQFGGAGPSWFMEGTAELLSVHRGSGPDVIINQVPADRESVPYWGRFKLMSQRREQAGIPSISHVLGYPTNLKSDVESYGWSWAAAMLLSEYPEYHDAFFEAARSGRDSGPGFNRKLRDTLSSKHWPVVVARWRLMCHDLDYGFSWDHERVELSIRDQLWDGKKLSKKIAADQGWQSLGVRLSPGMQVKIASAGRVTLANDPKPWISEPAGVTIRYHRGRPLGQLLAVMVPNAAVNDAVVPNLSVQAVTGESTIKIKDYCWLLFRVNDFVGELGDNQGAYEIVVQPGT